MLHPHSNLARGVAIAAVMLALLLNWQTQLDEAADQYLSDAISDNLVIYATARSLNGIISVIQSIELSVSLGAGVALNLGEILDPMNDLIERFSGFVLYGLAGLGLQQMVLIATASTAMKVVTSVGLLAGVVAWLIHGSAYAWVLRLTMLILIVRFAFVVEVGVIAGLDALYFDEQKEKAHSALELAQRSLSNLRAELTDAVADHGITNGMWKTVENLLGNETQEGVASLTARAVMELITITLVRGLLLPLAFVWLLIVAARSVLFSPDLFVRTT